MLTNTTTVRAETVEQAIEKGLKELGITRAQADVHVISEGKKGFLGFGKQDAIVEIRRQTDLSLKEITEQLVEEAQQAEGAVVIETVEVTEVIDLPEVEENEATVVDPEPITSPAQVDLEEGLVDDAPAQPVEVSEAATTPAEESEVVDYPAARQEVADYLEQVIKTYGAQAEIQIDASDKQVIYNIKTDKSGLVIGRHGRIINSLQTLAQVMLHNLYRRRISVLLNVGDYRDRRAMVLEQMAERAANDVLETRQPVFVEALPAYERKQIHYHISKHDHLSTHSEGKEPNRYLVVEYVE